MIVVTTNKPNKYLKKKINLVIRNYCKKTKCKFKITYIENGNSFLTKPEKIIIVSGLPKTRSGKIMRRIIRKLASGDFENLGDISTLLNPEVVDEIKNKLAK